MLFVIPGGWGERPFSISPKLQENIYLHPWNNDDSSDIDAVVRDHVLWNNYTATETSRKSSENFNIFNVLVGPLDLNNTCNVL